MSRGDHDSEVEAAVLRVLDELAVEYEVIPVDPELADTAAFCEHYGYPLEDSANCIVVASRREPIQYAACLNLAHTKLDVNKRVRKLMGVRKLSFATPEQTRDLTGMMIGGVTPFGLPEELPLYVDDRVMERERVIVGGGSRSIKLAVAPDAVTLLPNTQIIDGLATPEG
ncbi:MAG: YbaK/EbsC family protein [Nitriliruptorales bacterium]|nr:YbaK/EbsC family protein [Nitriliruptorales bacterium]